MNSLEDHVGGLVKITAVIYLYEEAKYLKLKERLCVLVENHYYFDYKDDEFNVEFATAIFESEADTLQASNQRHSSPMMRKPVFFSSFLIDDKVIKLLCTECDFEIIK